MDAVIHFGDLPVTLLATVPDSPPLFSYANSAAFAEIPFPDWTYWGSTGASQQRTWQVNAYRTRCPSRLSNGGMAGSRPRSPSLHAVVEMSGGCYLVQRRTIMT